MNVWELVAVMLLYTIAAIREYNGGNGPMSWVWFTYAMGIPGFIMMRK